MDRAESEIKLEQQKRAEAEETEADTRDQLSGVKSALGSQVMQLDQQCTQLQSDKVGHRERSTPVIVNVYMYMCTCTCVCTCTVHVYVHVHVCA